MDGETGSGRITEVLTSRTNGLRSGKVGAAGEAESEDEDVDENVDASSNTCVGETCTQGWSAKDGDDAGGVDVEEAEVVEEEEEEGAVVGAVVGGSAEG